MKPVIFGCSGTSLTAEERDFFASADPFGFILFQRNCANHNQVRELVGALRAAVGRADAPVFIDQEGGRVARLKPPLWPSLPPLRRIGELYERDARLGVEAMAIHSRVTARMLVDLGINGNCSPVLDLFVEGASSAIGDRAISRDASVVAKLAYVAVETFSANGVFPVIKHLPGHGRVKVDPHFTLPFVDTDLATLAAEDFQPFIALKNAPIGMNCHVVFRAIDSENPVSLSRKAHAEIIRGAIGFDGLLFSDDLAMKALDGDPGELANRALAAGADVVLYCTGGLPEMQAMSSTLPEMTAEAKRRWGRAQGMLRQPDAICDLSADLAALGAIVH